MGFFKKLWNKLSSGFFYVVDSDCLREYLSIELEYSLEYELACITELNLYLNGEKHVISAWNYDAEEDCEEEGVVFSYDKEDYSSLEELYSSRLRYIDGYYKIELVYSDNNFLNEYKAAHPELKTEDY